MTQLPPLAPQRGKLACGPQAIAKAVTRIQRWFRAKKTKMSPSKVKRMIVAIQARFRGKRTRARYLQILAIRAPWKDFLRPGECIVFTSQVTKTTSITSSANWLTSKKTRQLILTTGGNELEEDINTAFPPRLFYVDAQSRKWKGEIPYELDLLSGFAHKQTLLLFSRGNEDKPGKRPVWQFSLPNAVEWLQVLRRPVSVLELAARGRPSMKSVQHGGRVEMLLDGRQTVQTGLFLTPTELFWGDSERELVGGTTFSSLNQVRLLDKNASGQFPFLLKCPWFKDCEFRCTALAQSVKWSSQIESCIARCKLDFQRFGDTTTQAFRVFEHGRDLLEVEEDALGAKLKVSDAIALLLAQSKRASQANSDLLVQCFTLRAQANFALGLLERTCMDCTEAIKLMKHAGEEQLRLRATCLERLGKFTESLKDLDELLKRCGVAEDQMLLAAKHRVTKRRDFELSTDRTNQRVVWSQPAPIARAKQSITAEAVAEKKRTRAELLRRESSGVMSDPPSNASSPALMKRSPSRYSSSSEAVGSMRELSARAEDGIYASLRRISLRDEFSPEQIAAMEFEDDQQYV